MLLRLFHIVKSVLINAQVIFEHPYKNADTESKISFVSTEKNQPTKYTRVQATVLKAELCIIHPQCLFKGTTSLLNSLCYESALQQLFPSDLQQLEHCSWDFPYSNRANQSQKEARPNGAAMSRKWERVEQDQQESLLTQANTEHFLCLNIKEPVLIQRALFTGL